MLSTHVDSPDTPGGAPGLFGLLSLIGDGGSSGIGSGESGMGSEIDGIGSIDGGDRGSGSGVSGFAWGGRGELRGDVAGDGPTPVPALRGDLPLRGDLRGERGDVLGTPPPRGDAAAGAATAGAGVGIAPA